MTADETAGSREGGATVVKMPLGISSITIETSPVKPPERVSERLSVLVSPWVTLSVPGDNPISIAGTGSTTSLPLHAATITAASSPTIDLVKFPTSRDARDGGEGKKPSNHRPAWQSRSTRVLAGSWRVNRRARTMCRASWNLPTRYLPRRSPRAGS
jgi:hypothetical protein